MARGTGGRFPGPGESTVGEWIPIFRPAFTVTVPSTSPAMPYIVYKVIHYLGIFLLVVVLGASMGRRVSAEGPDPLRKRFAKLHGLALFLVLLGGFGLLARINVEHGALFPGWVWVKLAIWVILGGVIVLARRRAGWAMPLLLLVPVLAMLAGYVAYAKPF